MVQKKTKYIQIEDVRDVYITSDGKEFNDQIDAEYHEFTEVKLNNRCIYTPESRICDYESLDELKKLIDISFYSDTVLNFNYEELEFPNTYVLIESIYEPYEDNGADDIWIRETTQLDIMTLNEFKDELIKEINEFK